MQGGHARPVVVGLVLLLLLVSIAAPTLQADEDATDSVSVQTPGEPGSVPLPIYRNVTEAAGLGDFLHAGFLGAENGADPRPVLLEITGPGACWIDHDGDDLLDLYLVNSRYITQPEKNDILDPHSKLYRNNGDGTFTDVTVAANARTQGYLQGCAAADYDGDGRTDLFVTGYNGSFLLRNDGGVFTDVADAAGVRDKDCAGTPCYSSSASWFDADRDGCLDLFVAHFRDYDLDDPPPNGPGPGQVNRFYKNNCDGTFTDKTTEVGLGDEKSDSWSAVAADLDNDGWIDLYVSNDGDENDVYINNGDGTFTRRAFSAAHDPGAGMGTAVGDFDKDGKLDIVTTNYVSQHNGIYQAFGNDYLNIGEQAPFDDSYPYSGWATEWFDMDNDGHLDLMVANGMTEHNGFYETEQPILAYRNKGDGSFESVRTLVGDDMQELFVMRGGAWADYDNDGDVDFLLAEAGESPTHLFRADGVGNNFLTIGLTSDTPGVNRDAVGARVTLSVPGLGSQMKEKTAGSAFLSSGDPRLHFGLGAAREADFEIRWPDGSVETHTNVRANSFVSALQGAALETVRELPLIDLSGPDGAVDRLDTTGFLSETETAPGAGIAGYEWDFGDGIIRTGNAAETHVFEDVGAHTVRLTVTDTAGQSRTQWIQVVVEDLLHAEVVMARPSFGPFAQPEGAVYVTFPDGSPVRWARVHLVIERTTTNETADTLVDGMPFFVKEFTGFVPIEIKGWTGWTGRFQFTVPYNSIQPNPLVPIPFMHPGDYEVEATGSARGSTFEPAHTSYRVLLPDL